MHKANVNFIDIRRKRSAMDSDSSDTDCDNFIYYFLE